MFFLIRGTIVGAALIALAACAGTDVLGEPAVPGEFAGESCSGRFYAAGGGGDVEFVVDVVTNSSMEGRFVGIRPNKAHFDLPHKMTGKVAGNTADGTTKYGDVEFTFLKSQNGENVLTGEAFIYESRVHVTFGVLTCTQAPSEPTEEAASG